MNKRSQIEDNIKTKGASQQITNNTKHKTAKEELSELRMKLFKAGIYCMYDEIAILKQKK